MRKRWKRVGIIVRRRKKGKTFQVVYYDQRRDRRHYDRSFRSQPLAKEYAQKLELFINGAGPEPDLNGVVCDPDDDDNTKYRPWEEAVRLWIDNGPRRPKTRYTYALFLRRFGERTGAAFVEDVDEAMVRRFLVGLRNEGRSTATTAAYLKVLAAFFRSVRPESTPVTAELVACWHPYKDHKRSRPHIYTIDEFNRLIRACDQLPPHRAGDRDPLWWKTFITLLYECGLRLNEATHLIWQDVDLSAEEIRVAPHVHLKGVVLWRPKGKAIRSLPIPVHLRTLFEQMRLRSNDAVPYVFVSARRYTELLVQGLKPDGNILHCIRKGFVKIRDLAGISEGTIHDMRRTFVTNWLRKPEMSPEEVQILAGHEDLQTTLHIYSEVSEAGVVAKAKRMLQTSLDNASRRASITAAS